MESPNKRNAGWIGVHTECCNVHIIAEMMERLQKTRVVPMEVPDSAEDALPPAERLAAGGCSGNPPSIRYTVPQDQMKTEESV